MQQDLTFVEGELMNLELILTLTCFVLGAVLAWIAAFQDCQKVTVLSLIALGASAAMFLKMLIDAYDPDDSTLILTSAALLLIVKITLYLPLEFMDKEGRFTLEKITGIFR
ncbi:hypothetical protein ID106_16415 [Vibrio cholerae]|uniref:hypothetical protein n=1 Tax=Vibrio cholerae TaxID=666 RepID=UPI00372CBC5F